MGKRGGTSGKAVQVSYAESLQGQSVASVAGLSADDIKKNFNLTDASTAQLNAINDILRGMDKWDKGHDANKTPYKIDRIEVETLDGFSREEAKALGMRWTRPNISVSVLTVPDTDNSYLSSLDTKFRSVIIGANGGFFNYGKGGRKVSADRFDVIYGKYRD